MRSAGTNKEVNPITEYMRADTSLPPYLPYPRFLLHADLTQTATLLYATLLDRATLSQANGWTDEDGRIFLVFPVEKLAEALDKSPTTVKNALSELEAAELIERRRQGMAKPNRIYVKLPSDGQKLVLCDGQETVPLMDRKLSFMTDRKLSIKTDRKLSTNNLSNNYLNKNNLSRESGAPAAYGRYGNVFLKEDEYAALLSEYPDRLDRLISELSSYMESTGKSYQNHAATIRRWAEKDKADKQGGMRRPIPDYTCKEGESL